MSEWRTIDSAPRDGASILVHNNDEPGSPGGKAEKCWEGNTAVAAWWTNEDGGDGDWVCYMGLPCDPSPCFEPTHWMPLPEPPK